MVFMYLDGPDMPPTPLDDDFSSFLKMNESEGGGGGVPIASANFGATKVWRLFVSRF